MATILDTLAAYFREHAWRFEPLDGETAYVLEHVAGAHRWSWFACALEEEEELVIYSVAPLIVEPARRAAAMELITRINRDLVLGSFDLDLDDGEVRFRTSIDVEGVGLSPALLRPVLHVNLMMMEQYLPALIAVVEGTQPVEALARCQG